MEEFKVLFEQVEAAEERAGWSGSAAIEVLGAQNASIAELMARAQELEEPEPEFFSRG